MVFVLNRNNQINHLGYGCKFLHPAYFRHHFPVNDRELACFLIHAFHLKTVMILWTTNVFLLFMHCVSFFMNFLAVCT